MDPLSYEAVLGLPWVVGEGTETRKMAMGKNRIIPTLVVSIGFILLGPQLAGRKSTGLWLDNSSYLLSSDANNRAEPHQLSITQPQTISAKCPKRQKDIKYPHHMGEETEAQRGGKKDFFQVTQ